MKQLRVLGMGAWLLLAVGLIFIAGCAATGPAYQQERPAGEGVADIDELLGIAEEKVEQKESSDTIPEDDVLRLLGVEEKTTAVDTLTAGQEKAQLDSTVHELATRSTEYEKKTEDLKKKVSEQDSTLKALRKAESGSTSKEKSVASWKRLPFEQRYQEARRDYLARRYREAIQKFEALLMESSTNPLSDNCQYWIGESYYGMGKYEEAIVAFEKVFSFRQSNKDADAQLKLGLCYMRLNDTAKARVEFQKLIDNYPTSEYVNIARRFLDKIK